MSQLNITHVVVIALTAVFVLVAMDRTGELRGPQPAYAPPPKPEERAEVLDYLAEQFPPRRKVRGADNPFLK